MDIEELVGLACERAGLDDLSGEAWRQGLEILVDTAEHSDGVTDDGRAYLYGQFIDALWNRLRVVEYLTQHPEISEQRIERPLVILGLPRTGTTVASYLLDQDPKLRSLLNWEAADSVPPATTATLRNDPRCLARKETLDELADALLSARFPIPHWEDADGPTECTFVQNQDFKAFLWEAFMPTSAYSEWLLSTDMTSAYEYEHGLLRLLQSNAPGTWSLKMPSHAVHIEALLREFPDVRIIWAHRDPFRVTASFLSMNRLSRGQVVAEPDPATFVPIVLQQLQAHVDHPLRARQRLGDDRFFDLHYAELMRDPMGQMRKLYEWSGDDLTHEVEAAMNEWLARNPQDRFGTRSYSLHEYDLTVAEIEPLFDEYLSAFDVELEAV
jgi:hypothetical protein